MDAALPSVVSVGTVRLIRASLFDVVPVKGVGSGVILEGRFILTNNHVVQETREIEVTLFDGEKVQGLVRGGDEVYDVAVLEVEAKGLKPISLGDSDELRVGQMVMAVGNPLGLAGGPTVTTGVVSALNRSVSTPSGILPSLIQTDAAINPGNSGGPLLDSGGSAVGINTAIVPAAQGIGFAIPINIAVRAGKDILEIGRVRRPWLGIYGVTLNRGIANYYGLAIEKGVLIVQVERHGPAASSGLRSGDVLLQVDDKPVGDLTDLLQEVRMKGVGSELKDQVSRSGQIYASTIVLQESPR
ncbi:MAG: trypsin-like peptidase domain-containing protein [Candidatus Thermoplasmatota archaeon]|nr:trypsin-like peptidase domain-containing protein [Candidatus Thermoplasmatota archaeon]